MTGNYAVLVDAGFLMAESAKSLGRPRHSLAFDGSACVEWCRNVGHRNQFAPLGPIFEGRSFLRAYWYDAAYDPMDHRYRRQRAMFDALAAVPGLYLRLGHLQEIRPGWQRQVQRAVQACGVSLAEFEKHFRFRSELGQKGVDSLIALDLVQLARDHVVDAILLVSGDRDLAEAVRIARVGGCRVVVAHPPRAGVALALRQLADAPMVLEPADITTMLVPTAPALAVADARSARTP